MALVSLTGNGPIWIPPFQDSGASTPSLRAGTVLDAVGEQYGVVYEVGHDSDGKTIDKIGARIHTVTASGNVDARMETVDATNGNPSGTLATANSNLSQNVSATGWNEWVLTAGHSVSGGDRLSVILEIPGGSSANITNGEHRRPGRAGTLHPYKVVNTGGGYVKSTLGPNTTNLTLSVGFSDGTWEEISGSQPFSNIGNTSLSSTGTPEAGLEFQLPMPVTASDVMFMIDPNAAAFDIHLGNASYLPGDTGATRLSTRSVDPDILLTNSLSHPRTWRLGAATDLALNTTYRLTVEATTSTAVMVYFFDVDAVALLSAFPTGSTWKYIEDDGASGWTTTATRSLFMHIGISRFDNGAGGGGGGLLVHPGTSGGARG